MAEERQVMTSEPPFADMPEDRTDEMSFLEHLEDSVRVQVRIVRVRGDQVVQGDGLG